MSTKLLYHGSMTPGITILEPRKRFTPGSMGAEAPQAIYAGKTAAYAAAHAWPWSSHEGVDVMLEGATVVLIVPRALTERLEKKISIYAVPADAFSLLDTEPKGYNYWTHDAVTPNACDAYESVTKAVESNGGKVRVIG